MKIVIDCKVDITEDVCIKLVESLFRNRKPKDGSFDYGLESHGVLDCSPLDFPIHVNQTNNRKSDKSPIHLKIERHTPLI